MPGNTHATPIELLADSNRGVEVDLVKLAGGSQTVAGPRAQNVESCDYTLYVSRSFDIGGPSAGIDLRPIAVQVDIGAGSVLSSELAFVQVSARGVCYHACAQTMNAKLIVDAWPGGVRNVDRVNMWIAKGRPMLITSEDRIDIQAAGRNMLPRFARSMKLTNVFTSGVASVGRVDFYDAGGSNVGTYSYSLAAGTSTFDIDVIPPSAVWYEGHYTSGAVVFAVQTTRLV